MGLSSPKIPSTPPGGKPPLSLLFCCAFGCDYFDYYFSRHPYSKSELYDLVNSRFEPKNTPPPNVIQTVEEPEE